MIICKAGFLDSHGKSKTVKNCYSVKYIITKILLFNSIEMCYVKIKKKYLKFSVDEGFIIKDSVNLLKES